MSKNIEMNYFNGSTYEKMVPSTVASDNSCFLTTATAALFGLGADAVPNDVMQVLSRFQKVLGNEYVWEKTQEYPIYYEERGAAALTTLYASGQGACGKSIEINQTDGSVTITDLLADTPFTSTYEAYWKNKPPFYCMYNNELMYVAGPYDRGGTAGLSFKGTAKVSIVSKMGKESFGYVNSTDPNAYPIDDGYTYIALGQLGDKVRIATGSYTGTGTYGASNPNSLTFDFAPKMVIIPMIRVIGSYISFNPIISKDNNCAWIMMDALTTKYTQYIGFDGNAGSNSYRYAKKSADGKTIYWYNTQNQHCQTNDTSYTVYYVAIG